MGNFGSPRQLDYTAIGDTVNVASRLEGLNRVYGTEILISGTLWPKVRDAMDTRAIDRVAVKGREQGIMVYELVGEAGAVPADVVRWRDEYEEALDNYFKGDWQSAASGFERVIEQRDDDAAARLMLERSRQLIKHPPGDRWDGVFHAPK